MKFSIIIPTRNRTLELYRALLSVKTQTYGDFECIVVDDASEPGKHASLAVAWAQDDRFRCVELKEHSERAAARNRGFDAAKGEFFVSLDSDDEISSHYLEVVADAIDEYPDAKCFNFGAVVHHRKKEGDKARYTGTSIRPTFKPKWLGDRHEEFKGGKIGSGSFVFHRDVWDAIEHLPEVLSPYEFHGLAKDVHHLCPYPGLTLGNPWGDDFLLYFRITRKFQSIPLEPALYIQHVRT